MFYPVGVVRNVFCIVSIGVVATTAVAIVHAESPGRGGQHGVMWVIPNPLLHSQMPAAVKIAVPNAHRVSAYDLQSRTVRVRTSKGVTVLLSIAELPLPVTGAVIGLRVVAPASRLRSEHYGWSFGGVGNDFSASSHGVHIVLPASRLGSLVPSISPSRLNRSIELVFLWGGSELPRLTTREPCSSHLVYGAPWRSGSLDGHYFPPQFHLRNRRHPDFLSKVGNCRGRPPSTPSSSPPCTSGVIWNSPDVARYDRRAQATLSSGFLGRSGQYHAILVAQRTTTIPIAEGRADRGTTITAAVAPGLFRNRTLTIAATGNNAVTRGSAAIVYSGGPQKAQKLDCSLGHGRGGHEYDTLYNEHLTWVDGSPPLAVRSDFDGWLSIGDKSSGAEIQLITPK